MPYVPNITRGRVIKVYDGDTITIAAFLPNQKKSVDIIYRFSVRLAGIDTPERTSKDPIEKEIAEKARVALKKMVMGAVVRLEDTDNDKYGRLLAEVWCNGININEWMIAQRYAVRYDGGEKISPKNWKEYYENNKK